MNGLGQPLRPLLDQSLGGSLRVLPPLPVRLLVSAPDVHAALGPRDAREAPTPEGQRPESVATVPLKGEYSLPEEGV